MLRRFTPDILPQSTASSGGRMQFPRPDRIMDETTEDISTLPPPPLWRHCMAMLYDTLLVIPLFMAAAGVWVAVLGPTDSISEPAVPAYLQWCSWLVILWCSSACFGVARDKH